MAVEGTSTLVMEKYLSVSCAEKRDILSSSVTSGLIGTILEKIEVHQLLYQHLMMLTPLGMQIRVLLIILLQILRS
jgi:hypothetical protein